MATPLYIGPSNNQLAWSLVGCDIKTAENADEMKQILRAVRDAGDYPLVFADEAVASEQLEDIEKLNEQALPAIVLVSSPSKSGEASSQKLNQLMIRAIGSDIFSN